MAERMETDESDAPAPDPIDSIGTSNTTTIEDPPNAAQRDDASVKSPSSRRDPDERVDRRQHRRVSTECVD